MTIKEMEKYKILIDYGLTSIRLKQYIAEITTVPRLTYLVMVNMYAVQRLARH